MIESEARYAVLETIPGYTLRVPLGIMIVHDIEAEINEVYTAIHYLPTQDEKGFPLGAVSAHEGRAGLDLAKKISEFYKQLCQKTELSISEQMQKTYLRSILSPLSQKDKQ